MSIKALREALAAGPTPGPWEAQPIDPAGWVDIVVRGGPYNLPSLPFAACKHFNQEANAAYIAAAANAAPALLARCDELAEAARQALEAIEDARHHMSASGAFTEIQLAAQDALRVALNSTQESAK
jgi:hypothetical protein